MKDQIVEILEFMVSGQSFGINVAQVSEILSYYPLTPVPNAHPNIEGIFMPRGTTITAIDLKKSLNMPEVEVEEKEIDEDDIEIDDEGNFIVTHYNGMEIALHADEIIGIHRVEDAELILAEKTGMLRRDGYIESVIKIDGKLIEVLNFNKIISEVNPDIVKQSELQA